jgi:thiosulfate reductase cytochrome b subunit
MYLYPLWVRLWHLLNAVLVIILILTGISMQYTGKDGTAFLFGFAHAVKWHSTAAILLTACYIGYVTGNLVTENGKYYKKKDENTLHGIEKQLKYYSYGIFRGEKQPFPVTTERKFTPLQKFAYNLTMYVAMPLLVLSGLCLMFPEAIVNRIFGPGSLVVTDVIHITMGFFITIFLVIHIYACTLGSKPSSLFRGIITGYHESGNE